MHVSGVWMGKTAERAISVTVAGAVHAALLAAFIGWAPAVEMADRMDAVDVSLLGEMEGYAAPASSAADELQGLFQEVRDLSPRTDGYLGPERRAQPRSLSDIFGERDAPRSGPAAPETSAMTSQMAASGRSGDPGAQVSLAANRGLRTGLAPGGQIPPCWRRTERPVPVKMIIVIDDQGAMVGRPRIVREGAMRPDQARIADEAEAMRAIAGCAPFSLATSPGMYRSLQLDFAAGASWTTFGGMVRVE